MRCRRSAGARGACRAMAGFAKRSRCQTAYKPGSVSHRFREAEGSMTIHLGRSLPNASRDLPGRRRGKSPGSRRACRPYLVLLRVGFTVPPPSPDARCALTAPFHPCQADKPKVHGPGGLLSVALSLGFPPPGVTRHPFPVEPGLSSPRFDAQASTRRGHPAIWHLTAKARRGSGQDAAEGRRACRRIRHRRIG